MKPIRIDKYRFQPARISVQLISLWLTLGAVICYLAIASIHSYRDTKASAVEKTVSFAQLIAAHNAFVFEYAGNLLVELEDGLVESDFNGAVTRNRREAIELELERHWRQIPGIRTVSIADATGRILYFHGSAPRAESIEGREFVHELIESPASSIVGSSTKDMAADGNAIPVARRIMHNGRLLGMIVLTLSIEDVFYPFYATLDLGRGTVVKMRTRTSLVSRFPAGMSAPGHALPGETNPITRLIAAGHQKGSAEFSSQVDGTERFYSFERIGATNLYAVAAIPTQEVMDGAKQELAAAVAVCLAAMVAGIMATLGMRRLVEAHRTTQELAYHDALTGLKSRTFLNDLFPMMAAETKRNGGYFALVFADLDNFKKVNDALGHSNGDKLLMDVAQRIESVVTEQDVVIRFSGDSFVVLHPIHGGDPKHATEKLCWRLLDSLKKPVSIAGQTIQPSASVGASIYPYHGITLDELTRRADAAMYRGKCFGRGTFTIYYPGLDAQPEDADPSMRSSIVAALERGEFELFFSPCIDLKTGRISSVEALLRWKKEDGSILPAQNFIAVAEQSGMIVQIGKWVIDETCRTASKWLRAGLPNVPFSINVSALQFNQHEIEQTLADALKIHNVPAAMFQLEIREAVMLSDNEVVQGRIKRLNEIGIRIAVDDFGAGHASISCLHKHAVSAIKIDRQFAENAVVDQRVRPLMAGIITMAQAMGLRVVAEGIETNEALKMFVELGCDDGQGYLFSRPLSFEGLVEFHREFEMNP